MTTIRVEHSGITDLASDLRKIPPKAAGDVVRTVAKNVALGEATERGIAKAAAGPHGRNYFKRITSEMTGPMTGEWGPHDGGTPVGGGWRHGVNTDSAKSLDIVGPKFRGDMHDLPDNWFWDV